jgi:glyoxylase-like metal-dependent hydrolase (beta-lactamase superfamily II)
LIPTPGHTAGHQSLVLDALEGTVVLAGQALQSRLE